MRFYIKVRTKFKIYPRNDLTYRYLDANYFLIGSNQVWLTNVDPADLGNIFVKSVS
jgi:hypothetical protein